MTQATQTQANGKLYAHLFLDDSRAVLRALGAVRTLHPSSDLGSLVRHTKVGGYNRIEFYEDGDGAIARNLLDSFLRHYGNGDGSP